MLKRSCLKRNKSSRKVLKDKVGALQLAFIRAERGLICQICGKPNTKVGRFHILRVASHPRLEFELENMLLSCWMPCHYAWHAYGPNDPRNVRTLSRIKEIKGADYEEVLEKMEAMKPRHDMLYLEGLKFYYERKLEVTYPVKE